MENRTWKGNFWKNIDFLKRKSITWILFAYEFSMQTYQVTPRRSFDDVCKVLVILSYFCNESDNIGLYSVDIWIVIELSSGLLKHQRIKWRWKWACRRRLELYPNQQPTIIWTAVQRVKGSSCNMVIRRLLKAVFFTFAMMNSFNSSWSLKFLSASR